MKKLVSLIVLVFLSGSSCMKATDSELNILIKTLEKSLRENSLEIAEKVFIDKNSLGQIAMEENVNISDLDYYYSKIKGNALNDAFSTNLKKAKEHKIDWNEVTFFTEADESLIPDSVISVTAAIRFRYKDDVYIVPTELMKNLDGKWTLLGFQNLIHYKLYSDVVGKVKADGSKYFYCNEPVRFTPNRMAEYENGIGMLKVAMNKVLNLPESVNGTVVVEFSVNCEGTAFGFYVAESVLETSVNDQILEAIMKFQNWYPAIKGGKNVDCIRTVRLPVQNGVLI